MYCSNCGTKNEVQAVNCVNCGQIIVQTPIQSQSGGVAVSSNITNSDSTKIVKNNFVLAIVSLFFCVIPGVVSVIYASSVNNIAAKGDFEGAKKASKYAKIWAWIAIAIGIIIFTYYLIIFTIVLSNVPPSQL